MVTLHGLGYVDNVKLVIMVQPRLTQDLADPAAFGTALALSNALLTPVDQGFCRSEFVADPF